MRNLNSIFNYLKNEQIDGWLIVDYKGNNNIIKSATELDLPSVSRKIFYYLPADGRKPFLLVHKIEEHQFGRFKDDCIITSYKDRNDLKNQLKNILADARKIAMEYSPNADIPSVSFVDAGTIELIHSFNIDVCSSADLIQFASVCLSNEEYESHLYSAKCLIETKDLAFDFIFTNLKDGKHITEYDVQTFIMETLAKKGIPMDEGAIVAVNANSSLPHYFPDKNHFSSIKMGDWILIDMWSKKENGIFADITWVGYAGDKVPPKYKEIFDIVCKARDRGVEFISERFSKGITVFGYEVDDEVRKVITNAGYGDYFIHRTGHNLWKEGHGPGTNLDNFETHDYRRLLPTTAFTIEPGIYLPDFGVRSEIDVYITDKGEVIVTTERQKEIVYLLTSSH